MNILNLEKKAVKWVDVENLYVGGDAFLINGCPEGYKFKKLKNHKYREFIGEMVSNPEKDIEDFLYYKDKTESFNWWVGAPFTKEEAHYTTEKTLKLLESIKNDGYSTENSEEFFFNKKGLPDGAVTALEYKDKIIIISGYHRSSIALVLGIKRIPIILFKRIK